LISFSDKTHHDGMTTDLQELQSIPTGKQTERVVMRWGIEHFLQGEEKNELSITVRISNPINPLVFLQAALSKSPNDIDNLEFEMGSTCATVDGAGQRYADEVFLLVQKWIDARSKPHAFTNIHEYYQKYEWWIDQLSFTLLPFLTVVAAAFYVAENYGVQEQVKFTPIIFAGFVTLQILARRLNEKMNTWAHRSRMLSLFQITNGDHDFLVKMSAKARNSFIKLVVTIALQFGFNILAGIACWWITK
jgi:hypothetical protein